MKNILFLTNYSDHANVIYRYALKLGKQFDAQIHLAHIFGLLEQAPLESGSPVTIDGLELNKENWIDEKYADQYVGLHNFMLKETPAEYLDLTFDFHVQMGFTVEQVMMLVRENNIDLVVMGIHQKGRIADSIFGNIAIEMIDALPCDLFLIPDHGIHYHTIKKMLYATDLGSQDKDDIRYLLKWKKAFKSKLYVIHVCHNEQDIAVAEQKLDDWQNIFKKEIASGKLEFRVQVGIVKDEIQKYIRFIGAKMVCLTRHTLSHWPMILETSLSKDLARKVVVPVLILKPEV